MLIKKFFVPKNETPLGLSEINMHRLGKIVAIAGRNGSGKSRLLSKLSELVGARSSFRPLINEINSEISNIRAAINGQPNSVHVKQWNRDIEVKEGQRKHAYAFYITALHEEELGSEFKALSFVPKDLRLVNNEDLTSNTNNAHYVSAKSCGIERFAEVTLSYISKVQSNWFNATHPNSIESEEEKK